MGYLVSELRTQKWLDVEVSIAEFIKQNNISDDAMIYEMKFDKKVFKEEKEVREYLMSKCMSTEYISDDENYFIAKTLNNYQLDMASAVEVEIRRGVVAYAADLMAFSLEYYDFNSKGVIFSGCDLKEFKFSDKAENLPTVIEVARVRTGQHPVYGEVTITKEHLASFVNNFNAKATGTDLAVNEDHKKNEAFGWLKDIFLSDDKETLYGTVVWNAKGTRALSEKEYRYFSPELRFNYIQPLTGKEWGATLTGGALTNYPFLQMDAITELNAKNQTTNKGNQMSGNTTIELAVHDKTVFDLNSKITDLSSKLETANKTAIELNNEVKKLKSDAEKAKQTAENEKLFNEGKINKAQLDAMNEGKSITEILALNDKSFNTSAGGKGGTNSDSIELSADDKKLAKTLGMTEEEFKKGQK